MLYVAAAFVSSILYAISDNINGWLSKKNRPLQISFWSAIAGCILFLPLLLTLFWGDIARMTLVNLAQIIAISLLQCAGGVFFLFGMKKGSVMLTGVIAGSFPAVTTLLGIFLFHETLGVVQWFAVICILIGIALAALHEPLAKLRKNIGFAGILFAVGAFLCWGVYFALVRFPIMQVGWFMPQYVSNLVGIVLYVALALLLREKTSTFTKPVGLPGLAVASVCVICASLAYNYAVLIGPISVVAPISGSAPAIFAVIAHFAFRERLKSQQWVGILLAIFGVFLLSAYSA